MLIDASCTPSKQVSAAALKGNQILGQLFRAFSYRDRSTFPKLYMQFVRPHLELCVQAWNPWLQHDIEVLENVQKRAVNSISGLHGSYSEKLASINMLSLENRRRRGDMIETFKLIKGFEDVDYTHFFTLSLNTHRHATRQSVVITDSGPSPSYGVVKYPSRLQLRSNFFSQRIVNQWNALPMKVKCQPTVNAFKNAYDKL